MTRVLTRNDQPARASTARSAVVARGRYVRANQPSGARGGASDGR